MDIHFIAQAFPVILSAVPMTLFLTVVSTLLGLLLGFFIALARIYHVPVLEKLAVVFVSFIRGTPLLVQIYIAYYALPYIVYDIFLKLGHPIVMKDIPALLYAVVAFTFDAAAYLSETIRSSLESVDAGQMEAAYSVGMTRLQGMQRIVVPQALIVAIPNFGNLFLGFLKGTSLAFMISIKEIMAVSVIEASLSYDYIDAYLIASLIYLVIGIALERAFKQVEKKLQHFKAEVNV